MFGKSATLESLSRGFRSAYLDYAALSEQLAAWSKQFPDLLKLRSLGTSAEGRELWLAVVGPEPDRVRPSVWVDANMHGGETCGSSVALSIIEDLLRLHLEPGAPLHGIPDHVLGSAREVLFFVLPRLSPDGAEAVLRSGRRVRSVPRDPRGSVRPRWQSKDMDGDGLCLFMRHMDEAGDFIELPGLRGLMAPREPDDRGPYYQLYPEGEILDFDGEHVPRPDFLSDNWPDLNRNFPWSWVHEPEQAGAGFFPGSEPESRAVLEFSSGRPELFLWLSLHTFGGVFIRPLGHGPDTQMPSRDLALFRQIELMNETQTGYPTVSGFHEFTYEPNRPLHGEITDYAFHQRGAIAYVCELWDLFRELEMPRPPRFVDYYTRLSRADLVRLEGWDRAKNKGRLFRPWRPVEHPQLGAVEVGGLDARVGIWNPPHEKLAEICARQSAALLRVAALAPRLVLGEPVIEWSSEDHWTLSIEVKNIGYLPTYVLETARDLPHNEPLVATLELDTKTDDLALGADNNNSEDEETREPIRSSRETRLQLVSTSPRRVSVGHLAGWGRGRFGELDSLFYAASRGTEHKKLLRFSGRGTGRLRLSVGSARVGFVVRELVLAASESA